MKINKKKNVNITIKNNINNEQCEQIDDVGVIINKEKIKNFTRTIINETVSLKDTVIVNGNIFAGNIIRGDVVELKPGLVI